MNHRPSVIIVCGSESDLPVMEGAAKACEEFEVPFEIRVISAHRSPDFLREALKEWGEQGVKILIAGAGHAAHLAGALASHSILPVIGVPIDSSPLHGLDALYATVQMPPGVPVATMAVGRSGATNAGILAAQILALSEPALRKRLSAYKEGLAEKVKQSDARNRRGTGRPQASPKD